MPLGGEMAHHGGDVCELHVLLAKSLTNGSFLFLPEQNELLSYQGCDFFSSYTYTQIHVRRCANVFSFAYQLKYFICVSALLSGDFFDHTQIHIQNDHFFICTKAKIPLGYI